MSDLEREHYRIPMHQLRPRQTAMSPAERIRIAQAAGTQRRVVPISLSVPPWVEDET